VGLPHGETAAGRGRTAPNPKQAGAGGERLDEMAISCAEAGHGAARTSLQRTTICSRNSFLPWPAPPPPPVPKGDRKDGATITLHPIGGEDDATIRSERLARIRDDEGGA